MGTKRKKISTLKLLTFAFIVFSSVVVSNILVPATVNAYTAPTEESVDKQLQRTLLYAFGACLSVDRLKTGLTDDQINKHEIFAETMGSGFGSNQIAVGHEITANHDDNDGAVSCNNDLLYDKGLPYVGKKWADIRDMLYEAKNGSWVLKSGGDKKVDEMLQQLREPKRYSKDKAYGPQERKRRLVVAVSRCIEPVPDGNVAADAIVIGGKKYTQTKGGNERIAVGHDMQPDGTYQCNTLIDLARSENLLDGVDVAALKNNSGALAQKDETATSVIGSGTAGAADGTDNSCEGNSGVLGWIFCPVVKIMAEGIDQYEGYIKDQLITSTVDNNVQQAWSRVRNIALILLVPIMLVMVLSTALGFDFIDAYTVKRTLPRLAIAVILISLSFPLTKFALEIFNAIGNGIQGIMLFPWSGAIDKNLSNYLGGPAAATVTIGTGVALTLGWGVLLPLIASALIGILLGFVVLTLRQILILLLVITAPLAIIAWVLPGTEKLWKLWSNNFIKLLFMFPLIMALLAAGQIGAEMIKLQQNPGPLRFLLTVIAYVGPFFLIPATFKMGGTMFGALAGATMGSLSGARKYLRGRSGAALKQRGQDLRNQNYFKGAKETGFRASLNKGLQGASYANRLGVNPTKWRGNIGRAVEGNQQQQRAAMLEDEEYADWKMNDTANREAAAATDSSDFRRRLQALGSSYTGNIERDVARYDRLKRRYGDTAFRQRTTLQAIAGGTAYGNSVEALEAIAKASSGDRATEADMISEARKSAMNAGRIDQGGNSFGKTISNVQAIQQLQQQRQSGAIDEAQYQAGLEQIRQKQNMEVLEAQGPDVITHSSVKTSAMKELIPQFQERIQAAYASGNQEQVDRELAIAASVYDGLARSNPEKARIFGDEVMLWDPSPEILPVGVAGPPAPAQSLLSRVEARRGSEVFRSTRREYDSRLAAESSGGAPPEPGSSPTPPLTGGPVS